MVVGGGGGQRSRRELKMSNAALLVFFFCRSHWERTVVILCLVIRVGEMASYDYPVYISTVSCRQPLQAQSLPGALQTCRLHGMKCAGL